MYSLDYYKKNIYRLLNDSIKKNIPDAVLLSGGVDSSSVAYLSVNHNPGLSSITVISENKFSSDKKYAMLAAKNLNINNHSEAILKDEETPELIRNAVLSMGIFNIYWISASVVLLKGLAFAKSRGFNKIATGEGADDLFGSFPVMIDWIYGDKELKKFIRNRIKDIDIMTKKLSEYLNINIITPFFDEKLIDFALKIPIDLKIKRDCENNKVISKFILREAFREYLPETITNRPQTMAFTGASTLDLLTEKYKDFVDIEEYRKKYNINFKTSFECFLFDILNKAGGYNPVAEGNRCLYCKSKLRSAESVHCPVCGTLQYNNKILDF